VDTVPLDLLSPYGNREQATGLTRTATGLPLIAAHNLVLTLDATSTAILRTAGLTVDEARPILAALWRDPGRITDTDPARLPPHRLRRRRPAPLATGSYLPDLGERLRVIRKVRKLPVRWVADQVGLLPDGLRDLEAGATWPTLPLLLALADTLQVPVPMLVDPHATPLRILRLLSGQYAAA
jgi:hypothetical protein